MVARAPLVAHQGILSGARVVKICFKNKSYHDIARFHRPMTVRCINTAIFLALRAHVPSKE